MHGQQNIKKTA